MDNSTFEPLIKRPALTVFGAVVMLYIMAEHPVYAAALLPVALLVILHVPKWLLKMSIVFLVIAGISLYMETSAKKDYAVALTENLSENGYGKVVSLTPRANGVAVIVETEHGRIRLSSKDSTPPLPGDSIAFTAKYYRAEKPTVPGEFNTPKWLASAKLRAYGSLERFAILREGHSPERYFYNFRIWLRGRLRPFCSNGATGLLMGLLAGDRSGISDTLQNDFRRAGLVHVLAISGFHVVLLSSMLMLFLKSLRLPHNVARVTAILLLLLYIPVTGGSAAVTRAVLMFSVVEAGALLQRKADSLNSLGVALLAIVLYAPSELWSPGFQLSAAATAGIIAGQKTNPLGSVSKLLSQNALGKLFDNYILQNSYVTFCATLSTAPFLAYHFQSISPIAWLGNIIVVPCVSLSMYAGLFTVVAPLEILQQNFGSAADFFLRIAAFLTKILSDSPNTQLTIGPFPVPILCLASLLFALLPLASIRFYRRTAIAIGCGLAIYFCANVVNFYLQPHWELTVLDVEQADSILLETPEGRHFLFDAGNGSKVTHGKISDRSNAAKNKIVPHLRHKGIRSLDAVIITHADADHYGGLTELIKTFPVNEIWISECAHTENKVEWQNVLGKVYQANIPVRDVSAGFYYREKCLGKSCFEMLALHPVSSAFGCGETNKESTTFAVQGLGHSALLTGDLTKEGENEILARLKNNPSLSPDVDFLKLGHHGSKTSSSVEFLNAVSPYYAVASAGRKNMYRHPHKVVTDRLDSLHIPWLNTAKVGSVYLHVDGHGMLLSTELGGVLKFWR